MLFEIPKWFKKSTLRREKYKILFETLNAGEERVGIPLPFLGLSITRWLVRGKVLYNILVNWLELKTFFSVPVWRALKKYDTKHEFCLIC